MIRKFVSTISVFLLFLFLSTKIAFALNPVSVKLDITPIPCPNEAGGNCHKDLNDVYTQRGEACTTSYDAFLQNPAKNHFWIEDPDITAQGKADERARQFIYWTLNKNAIDDHPVLKSIWSNARNIAFFFTIVVAAILGVGLMIGQRMQYDLRLQVWPIVFKILLSLVYIAFSATIVILLIQISELFMRFFNETLGGRDLFNIYFSGTSQEKNYTNWIGCRDINYRVQEGAEAEIMMLKLTNITYYVMGGMLLLRKVLLWFMLFVSPFLAILMPFVFIRNTGWIWIGVFFQWLFYGPLFALFLGATHQIWLAGIPYPFDFSRVNQIGSGGDSPGGYVYPTAINILYGGPAQGLQIRNNGNYADTFAEYVLSLIMLWGVTFFPWWLLRIFRDYCCDSIMAMKNILLAMFDQGRGGPGPQGPGPIPNPLSFLTGTALKVPQKADEHTHIKETMKLERIEEIKQAKTEEITSSMQISAKNITDIARIETNKETREAVNRNINFLQNPMQATTSKERQQFMNIKSELFNRAVKEDHVAKQVLTTLSTSKIEQMQKKQEFVEKMPQAKQASVTNIVSVKVKMPQDKVASITNNFINSVSKNTQAVTNISNSSGVSQPKVQTVLVGLSQYTNEAPAVMVDKLEKQTGVEKQRVIAILKQTHAYVAKNKDIAKEVAEKEKVKPEEAQKVFDAQIPAVTEPEKQVEHSISIPPTVSIEDYEEVKKMWKQQYVSGEVPVTDTVKTRDEWIEQDVVFVTNTLNKLVSNDEKLKTEGLEDLGYILPVFMVNNFTPEEVLVYLKAKLEAAKEVNENVASQKMQVKTAEEEFVDVAPAARQEVAQEMHLEEAMAMPEPTVSSQKSTPDIDFGQSTEDDSFEETSSFANIKTSQGSQNTTNFRSINDESESNQSIASPSQTNRLMTVVKLETTKSVQQIKDLAATDTQNVLGGAPQSKSLQSMVSDTTKLSAEKTSSVNTTLAQILTQNEPFIKIVSAAAQLPSDQVTTVINNFNQSSQAPYNKTLTNVSTQTKVPADKVSQILSAAFVAPADYSSSLTKTSTKSVVEKETVEKVHELYVNGVLNSQQSLETISSETGLSVQKTSELLSSLFNEISESSTTIDLVGSQVGLPPSQVQSVLQSVSQTIVTSPLKVIEETVGKSGVSKEKVVEVIKTTKDHSKLMSGIIKDVAQKANATPAQVSQTLQAQAPLIMGGQKNVLGALPQSKTLNTVVSDITKLSAEKTSSVSTTFAQIVSQNEPLIKIVSTAASIQPQQVTTVINTMTQTQQVPFNEVLTNVSTQTKVPADKVSQILSAAFVAPADYSSSLTKTSTKSVVEKETVEKVHELYIKEVLSSGQNLEKVANEVGLSTSKTSEILSSLFKDISESTAITSLIGSQVKLEPSQVGTILQSVSQFAISSPSKIVEESAVKTSLSKEKVTEVIKTTQDHSRLFSDITKDVAQKANATPAQVSQTLQAQAPLMVSPNQHIEKAVSIPQSVSIEDYEEVKGMWKNHYETGDVPVSETIKNRDEWIEQDTVFVTNTLNRLLSSDEKLRDQGLDDLGYILPTFLTNNFTPEEILVYLKAKLEAGKEVKTSLAQAPQKMQTEFVDVSPIKKKETAKEMRTAERTMEETIRPSLSTQKSEINITDEKKTEKQPTQDLNVAKKQPASQKLQKSTPIAQTPSVAETLASKTAPATQQPDKEKELVDLLKEKSKESATPLSKEKTVEAQDKSKTKKPS